MNIIMPKKPVPARRRVIVARHLQRALAHKRAWHSYALLIAAFALANVAVAIRYHDRTFANTAIVGQRLGVVKRADLAGRLKTERLLPQEITFSDSASASTVKIPMVDLDIKQDPAGTAERAVERRSWLPVANLFIEHDAPLQLIADSAKLQAILQYRLAGVNKTPTNAKIIKQGGSFVIKGETNGTSLDATTTAKRLITALQQGDDTVTIATTPVAPNITSQNLQPKLTALQEQAKTSITLQYEDKSKKLSPAEMAALYTGEVEGAKDSTGVALSDIAIQNAVIAAGSGFGIGVQNLTEATAAIKTAVQGKKNLTFKLAARPFGKIYYYCTDVRGVSTTELPELAARAKVAFSDSRGWNLGGLVSFQPASANCDFTIWLTAADQMLTFGEICDPEWSCAVPPNVVINYDRWRLTTAPWKRYGGSLDDYRTMAINHETGHWLGFAHDNCPGAGQPAPVMQQQSVDLQGCTFNPWPTTTEQAALKQRLGL